MASKSKVDKNDKADNMCSRMIGVNLTIDQYNHLEQIARYEDRSLSNLVRKIVKAYLDDVPKL